MKYRLEGVVIEAVGQRVRVTVGHSSAVTDRDCPSSVDIAALLSSLQGYWPNRAQLQACGRAADDARRNMLAIARMTASLLNRRDRTREA